MTIRIYPSQLPGEPLETHEHGHCSVYDWFMQNVEGFDLSANHPVYVEVEGKIINPEEWPLTFIQSDSDVRILPVPYGIELGIMGWIAIAVSVASVAFSLYMMSQMRGMGGMSQPGNGDSLELNPAKANSPKLGQPIREVMGKAQIYPDYVLQPISRFRDKKVFYTDMFLAIGVGNFAISASDIRIGNTPVSSFGEDVSYKIYPPGADVSADHRSENWYNSTEVGNTSSGTAGLDLGSSGPESVSISADAVFVSDENITLIGQTSDDDEDDDTSIPESWKQGTLINVKAPANYSVINTAGYSVIYGDLTELTPAVGMAVTLNYLNKDYALIIDAFVPEKLPIPGVGGSSASITASAAPVTYDFIDAPATFFLIWKGESYAISLTENYLNMSGVVETITGQLTGSGLIAQDLSGRIAITEESSPWSAGNITHSDLPVDLFGSEPVSVSGVASSGGAKGVDAHIWLKMTTGAPFSGLSDGTQRLSLGRKNFQYRIVDIDGLTISVERMIPGTVSDDLIVDALWPGFTPRTLLDFAVTGLNDDSNWIGPFVMSPEGEDTSRFEINLNFQSGLCRYDDRGNKGSAGVELLLQYRQFGDTEWVEKKLSYNESTEDQIGFTESYDVPSGQYEIRMRRVTATGGGSTRDGVFWQSLRCRLNKRPSRYAKVTTIALTVRTGNRIAAQSDRRVNIRGTRIYDGFPRRSISGAFHHVLLSAGMQPEEIDSATISDLEEAYWTPRGEYFDFEASSDSTKVLDMMQKITNAGMGYFLLSDGLVSAGREGIKPWVGAITPHEMVDNLETQFTVPSQDDYDGVDVTYINERTWATETVQCRTSDNLTPRKIEDYTLDGVLSEDRAWRIGMRRLMKYLYQRLGHSTRTEMDARAYDYNDRIVLTDDIPGSDTISCLVISMEHDERTVTLQTSEPLDWNFSNPRVLIRFQDSSASPLLVPERIDDYSISLPVSESLRLDEWITDDPSVEPPRLIFCSSQQVGYDALLASIEPSSDGTTTVSALQYSPLFYQHDDATYPGNVS